MAWHAFRVVFRLRTPTHIGWGKTGNLQRTRSYVTGRSLWGALTMRLTRDTAEPHEPASDSHAYQRVGEEVHQSLAYTYFYPATALNGRYQIAWPWEQSQQFRYRFLSSYSGTALTYPQQSAATGMLHEVEFLSPHTIDSGEPVFLVGYVFEADSCSLRWKEACQRLQIGGERGYGWGDIALISCQPVSDELFDGRAHMNGNGNRPVITLQSDQGSPCSLLAHTFVTNVVASGDIEPLVGREWRSNNARNRYVGQHIAYTGFYFAPGSKVKQQVDFVVEHFGIWRQF